MKKNYFWGILLILLGGYLIISQMGYLPKLDFVTVFVTIICIYTLIQSLIHINFGGILFSLAFLGIIYDDQLGITAITPWTILLAALLGSIGLDLIFGKNTLRHHRKPPRQHNVEFGRGHNAEFEQGEEVNGENIYLESTFGSLLRYVTSDNLQYANIETTFSGAKIYFDGANIPSGNATINIKAAFSGIELFIPHEWQVINHLNSIFGGVKETRQETVTSTGVSVTLEGENTFSGITIHYI